MIEFHYRGMRVGVAQVESVVDRESGVIINGGLIVDESYDEVVAKAAPTFEGGYVGGVVHIKDVGMHSARLVEGKGPWYDGFACAVADVLRIIDREVKSATDCPPSGLRTRSQEEKDEIPVTQRAVADSNPAGAAIEFSLALEDGSGLDFLRLWNEGEFDTLREEWTNIPDDVFIGADVMFTEKEYSQTASKPALQVHYMNPLTGETNTLDMWTRLGFASKDLAEVISDGQGCWTPVK